MYTRESFCLTLKADCIYYKERNTNLSLFLVKMSDFGTTLFSLERQIKANTPGNC